MCVFSKNIYSTGQLSYFLRDIRLNSHAAPVVFPPRKRIRYVLCNLVHISINRETNNDQQHVATREFHVPQLTEEG